MIRKLLGAIGRMLLTAEDKKALRQNYIFRLRVTEAETWLCGFPQMRYALQYIRVRTLGPGSASHTCLQTDTAAQVDISTFREKMRRLYEDESQHLPDVPNCDSNHSSELPKWYTCHVCKRSQPASGSKKCCGYYLTQIMEEEPVLNFDKERGVY